MVFEENTTLFALWQTASTGSKLPAPIVNVNSTSIRWNSIFGANGYKLEISGPNGYELTKTVTPTIETLEFSQLPAGDYDIKVTALSSTEDNNSQTTIRLYKNKALARVSLFNVIGTTLLFNEVKNATKYTIAIDCGDKLHNHDAFDNGNSTFYNFANCPMQSGGIKFVVKAYADGYATSESTVFNYNKVLSPVSNFYLVESTQTLMWQAVQNASNYIVSVKSGNGVAEEIFDIGNKTSFSLKEYSMRDGGIEIKVYPMTKGWNSPASSTFTYHKTTPAAPRNITFNIVTVSWTAVEGATSYEIRINDQIFTSDSNSFALPDTLTLTPNTDYELTVRTSVDANKSLWSESIIIRDSMYQTLTYSNGVVSWKNVKEATLYEVKVNDNTLFLIDDVNYANIVLDKAGINTIYVRAYDGIIYSNEATIEVYAHAIDFYSNGGTSVNSLYKAVGDSIGILPTTTRDGYDFMGWYTSIGGAASNGLRYTDTVFAENGDITLYAYYLPKTYTIAYDGSEETESITYGNRYKLNVPVSNDGTIFVGWYSAINGGGVKLTDDTGKSLSMWNIANNTTIYAFWKSALTYTLIKNDTEYSVKKAADINLVTTLSIPSVYDGKPVSEIYTEAFKGCTSLITVTIPDSITSIGANAFLSCTNLISINVNENNAVYSSHEGVLYSTVEVDNKIDVILVCYPMGKSGNYTVKSGVTKIGANAFDSNTNLNGITISKTVKDVGNYAFRNCTALITVTFENGGTQELAIGTSAFEGCSNLSIITFPDNLKDIGNSAFKDCKKLVTVTLPDSVKTILDNAFKGCSELRSINLPDSITSIATYIFQGCTVLGEIVIPKGITSVPNNAFQNCKGLASVTLPDSIISIGNYAFDACSALAAIELPEGLTTINRNAFSNCSSLISIIIGIYAFQNCTSLSEITIPVGVTVLDNYTFSGCKGLSSISLPDGLTKIGTEAFASCEALTEIHIPDSVKDIQSSAFINCIGLEVELEGSNNSYLLLDGVLYSKDMTTLVFCAITKSGVFTVPNSIATIAPYAFYGNKGITNVILPESVLTIGTYAFAYCEALTEVNIPSKVTILNECIFSTCNVLETIAFAENSQLVTIGKQAFLNCNSLTNVTIPSGVTSIGQQAFGNCNSLGDITIPSGVTTALDMTFYQAAGVVNVTLAEGCKSEIGNMAFQRCANLESITLSSGAKFNTNFITSCFSYSPKLIAINVNENNTVLSSLDGVLFNKAKTTLFRCPEGKTGTFVIPNTVATISNNAFANCVNITGVTIPSSVTNIGTSAFENCTSLATVTFDGTMKFTSIGALAFKGCSDLTSITIPDSVTSITNTAFQSCTSLTAFLVSESHTAFKAINGVLFSKDGKTLLSYPGGKEGTYEIPNGVTSIGQYAFSGSSKVTGITVPDSVTSIGAYAFQNCTALTEITLSDNITTIDNYTFDG